LIPLSLLGGEKMTEKKTVNKKTEIKDVQPIRSLEKIEDMKWSLKKWCGERDYIMFLIGINTGLRIGDLLKFKVVDIKGKKRVVIYEGKTKKKREINLSNIYDELNAYINTLGNTKWLFPSRKGYNAISTTQAYRQFVKAAEMVDIESVGLHTCRKTFGFWFYKKEKDIAKLQYILNHDKPSTTLLYIGITQEEVDDSLSTFLL